MTTSERAPHVGPVADLDKPSAARIYDWYLGGDHNYAVDREFGKKMVNEFPQISALMHSNRRWMGRVVRHALKAGITQFLDLGTGIPTVGNIHDIVDESLPAKQRRRVVYVDNEPVAKSHTEIILQDEGIESWAGIAEEDLRYPQRVMEHETTKKLLDLSQPVCVLMVSVLHFLGEGDRPADIVAGYREHLVPGSWIALSHVAVDDADAEQAHQVSTVAANYQKTQNPIWLRDRARMEQWFQGTTFIEPGFVHLPQWRPEEKNKTEFTCEDEVQTLFWCGVGEVN